MAGLAPDAAIEAPPSIVRIFEAAELIRIELSVPEAAQLAAQGKLVVLRDRRVQERQLVSYGAVSFAGSVDWTTVRLWWPRIFSSVMPVALMSTEHEGVWIETTMGEEDLPE